MGFCHVFPPLILRRGNTPWKPHAGSLEIAFSFLGFNRKQLELPGWDYNSQSYDTFAEVHENI